MPCEHNVSYQKCSLCARECSVDRTRGEPGYCRMPSAPVVARAALHMWEEPVISGSLGSGAIFFTGCSLGCVYCQNREISRGLCGKRVSEAELCEMMLRLSEEGAHNINLVTPTHYAPSIIDAVASARAQGLSIPIVYNTASYDSMDTLRALDGTVDIYLPDLKYYKAQTAARLSGAADYCDVSFRAISEMVRQQPLPVIEGGLMKRGVIVRILLLPGHLAEAKLNLKRVYEAFGKSVYISLMSQYTPMDGMKPPLDRRVRRSEYDELVGYAIDLGVEQAFTQDRAAAEDSYIPPFDLTGVR